MRKPVWFLEIAALIVLLSPLSTRAQGHWTRLSPVGNPPGNLNSMVYDESRDRVVLYNGQIWEYDRRGWGRAISGGSPRARGDTDLAYDSVRKRTILFGGSYRGSGGGTVYLNDTWEWDGRRWHQQAPSTSPLPRAGHSLIYDAARGRTVMFGGTAGARCSLPSQMWEWDGLNWAKIPGAVFKAERHAAAYDSHRNRIVAYGGRVPVQLPFGCGEIMADGVVEFSGGRWTHVGTAPFGAWLDTAMVYDEGRRRMVLVGGRRWNVVRGQTWEWDGSRWMQQHTVSHPVPVHSAAVAFDSNRNRVMLHGGVGAGIPQDGTWEYGGRRPLEADTDAISNRNGGQQRFLINAGVQHRNRAYLLVGSSTGTTPGVHVGGVHVPLDPDGYTSLTLRHANSMHYRFFQGTLDAQGQATASFYIAAGSLPSLIGTTVHHAYLVHDAKGIYMASNALPVTLQ